MKGFPTHATVSRTISSPVGNLILLASAEGLAGLFFGHRIERDSLPSEDAGNGHLAAAEKQLREYFAGKRTRFDLPFDVAGTDFQKRVWAELSRIPFGVTRSYGEIAARIGNPKSVRAVGLANGANPLSVIVPCHRVIGANGSLTGFGGGLELKRRLLVLEGALLDVA
ncbi:MAG: methylated-DNA--[protein]-cysteine S-methyltransferase [Verrucomicrobia bacterium]|nr:methylated-DNA--[protein]-cysteine S-methyltransferase [Verrucomicrobiota bacterium]MDA1005579.1 methylated-DNA--[protein]-cysteine S-methyltransferase [Verrucomicrobiota bacterium]